MIIARPLLAGVALLVMSGCRSSESSSPATPPSASSVPASAQAPVASSETSSRELVLHVEGLTCEGCAWQIRETLQKVDGIVDVRTTVADKRVVVTYDPRKATSATATQALEQVGYKSEEVPR